MAFRLPILPVQTQCFYKSSDTQFLIIFLIRSFQVYLYKSFCPHFPHSPSWQSGGCSSVLCVKYTCSSMCECASLLSVFLQTTPTLFFITTFVTIKTMNCCLKLAFLLEMMAITNVSFDLYSIYAVLLQPIIFKKTHRLEVYTFIHRIA